MDTPIPDDKLTAIKEAIYSGHTIEAIKIHRETAHSGLMEAKNAIEKLEADLRATSPEKFVIQRSRSGCFSVLAILVIAIGILCWSAAR